MTITKTVKEIGVDLIVIQQDSGQGDGTENFYFELGAWDRFSVQVDDTPGTAGTNTYKVFVTNEPETALPSCFWTDVTNDLYGVASFTADKYLPVKDLEARAVKIERVRTADGGSNDGGSKIWMKLGG